MQARGDARLHGRRSPGLGADQRARRLAFGVLAREPPLRGVGLSGRRGRNAHEREPPCEHVLRDPRSPDATGDRERHRSVLDGFSGELQRAMFLSAFACMNADPASRAYYDEQRGRGKTHTQAFLRLAHQRISALFAMLRDGTFYQSRTPAVDLAA